MKYKHYVGIIDGDNKISYVTRIENSTKTFHCEKGKEAKVFTKTGAEDLVYCLVINNYNAVVLRVPDFYNYVNSSEEKGCKSKNAETEEYPFKCKVGNNSEIHSRSQEDYDHLISDIADEAVKEFAGRLKEKRFAVGVLKGHQMVSRYVVDSGDIDNLLKEKVGDENA